MARFSNEPRDPTPGNSKVILFQNYRVIDLQIPERAQLAEILCNRPNNLSPAELLELRIQAAKLMAILCGKRKTGMPDRIRRRVQAHAGVTVKEESLMSDPIPLLMDRN
ncbi:hypothetical protein P885DRAFT_58932 [Corynascus similis CBS 632.67]